MDGQTTCDRNTALCTKVHRAVKTRKSILRSAHIAEYILTAEIRPDAYLRTKFDVCVGLYGKARAYY